MRSHRVTIFSLFLISSIRVAEADVENSVDFLSPSPMIEINGERCYEALDRETVNITLKATRADPPNKKSGRNLRDMSFLGPNESPLAGPVSCLDVVPCLLEYKIEADDRTALIYGATINDYPGDILDYKELRLIVSQEKPLEFTCSLCSQKKDGSLLIEATTEGYPSASSFILRDNYGNIIENKTTAKKVLFNIDLSDWEDADVNFTLTAINRLNKSVDRQIEISKQPESPDTVDWKTPLSLSVVSVVILIAITVFCFRRHKLFCFRSPTVSANGVREGQQSLSNNVEPMESHQLEPPPSSGAMNSSHQQTSNPLSEEAQLHVTGYPVITINNNYYSHNGSRSEDVTIDDERDNDSRINGKHAPKPRTETTSPSSLPSSDGTGSLETDNMMEQYSGEHPEQWMEELKSPTATNGSQTDGNEIIESSDDNDLQIDGIRTLSKPVQESGGAGKASSSCINQDYRVKVHFDNENIDAREDSHDKVTS